ncbi:MAG: RNA-protein complex protein Nop10 [Candidatus Aenigmatarchaeota archaeon]
MKKIKKCPSCGGYTLAEYCDRCDEKTVSPKPPSYSPEDRYGEYRRKQIKRSR